MINVKLTPTTKVPEPVWFRVRFGDVVYSKTHNELFVMHTTLGDDNSLASQKVYLRPCFGNISIPGSTVLGGEIRQGDWSPEFWLSSTHWDLVTDVNVEMTFAVARKS